MAVALQEVSALMQKLSLAKASTDDRKAAAARIAEVVKSCTPTTLPVPQLSQLKKLAEDAGKAAAAGREGALLAFAEIAQTETSAAKLLEPFLVSQLPLFLTLLSDKVAPVRAAAYEACRGVLGVLSPLAIREAAVPALLEAMVSKQQWQTKVGALNMLSELCRVAPRRVAECLSTVVPRVSECMVDVKEQVKSAAAEAMGDAMMTVGNRDIEPFVPAMVSCIARPAEVADCIHKLAATTFVQSVESPTLSIMVPLLVRGLRERVTPIKRKAAVIIDNMAKLVEVAAYAAPFLPQLLPELEKVAQEVADPEVRQVASRAAQTLMRVGTDKGDGQTEDATAEERAQKTGKAAMEASLRGIVGKETKFAEVDGALSGPLLGYVAAMASSLAARPCFEAEEWSATHPYLSAVLGSEAAGVAAGKAFLERCYEEVTARKREGEAVEEEGEDLCNCQFSLAYGAKILLNMATLHLKRGKRYGLCGPNGAGKSTLMRAISVGQVEGFPPADQLRTVYVEHDIQASLADLAVVEFVFHDPAVEKMGVAHKEVETMLASVGFSPEMQAMPVAALSGGWKMKLALARAMLLRADILLLDEPTNHLDVTNVAWLMNYLKSLDRVTSMIVSHDSGFLDDVCTHIIHYEGRKLKNYRGNLSAFVKAVPEARSYYELAASPLKFKFPEPGFLDGVKTKDKAILKMTNVGFTYPGTSRKVLQGVSLYCALNTRVAVIGANGAGKSTMIKILTGELETKEGIVWKHPNLRIAYVAQHAFHHIEKHLDKTPNQYIQWRYAIGEDREALTKVDRKLEEEEEAKLRAQVHVVEGEKRKVEKLLARRKCKKGYEYEVQWQGTTLLDKTTWLDRQTLEGMGYAKMLVEIDAKEAAAAGMWTKPLTSDNIAKHLEDVGLESEFSLHSQIRGLSGGQKVKLVLGAAMWNNPHMLVLDEPTNYLDRDSLGALAEAIKEFGGGVVIISHSREFTDAICNEKWTLVDGKMTQEGGNPRKEREVVEIKVVEEMTDAHGNTVKVKQQGKKLSRRELKDKARLKKLARELGEIVSDDEE